MCDGPEGIDALIALICFIQPDTEEEVVCPSHQLATAVNGFPASGKLVAGHRSRLIDIALSPRPVITQ